MRAVWRTRRMKREGVVVWCVYRLRDPAGPDVPENRIYWPASRPGWCETEYGAGRYADLANQIEKERAAHGAGTP